MSRWKRFGIGLVVVALHIAAVIGLIRAFAPDFSAAVVEKVAATLTVTITSPPPEPQSTPPPTERARADEGAAATAGKKAAPREVAAPKADVVLARKPAPPIASKGDAVSAGAADRGPGTGAGGEGAGTGAGRGGDGPGGGGVAAPAIKIAGDINSAKDYPKKSRDLRIGDYVIVVLTVAADGRPSGCRVHRPSRDPEADRITCRLALERFRFRPALDAGGNPVRSEYGWQQRWFRTVEN